MDNITRAVKATHDEAVMSAYYGQLVSEKIRERYSVDAELAIHRQREEKPEEFADYYSFVEECKAQARLEIYGEEAQG